MKTKCLVCGYETDITNKKCPRCNSSLLDSLKCRGNCKGCKQKCSIRY